jgi:hypothetical protein
MDVGRLVVYGCPLCICVVGMMCGIFFLVNCCELCSFSDVFKVAEYGRL